MKRKNMMAVCGISLLLTIGAASSAFAATGYKTPADAVAGVTGMTLDEVAGKWNIGQSYGAIAADAGKLPEYHTAVLDLYSNDLNACVASGSMTRAQADAYITDMSTRQASCNGSGSNCGYSGCVNNHVSSSYSSGSYSGRSGGHHGGGHHGGGYGCRY